MSKKKRKIANLLNWLTRALVCLLAFSMTVNQAAAQTADTAIFDEILAPVTKIMDFVKYAATILAVLYLIFAGVSFVMSGGNAANRERSKHMAAFVVVGLSVIWAAPFVVNYLIT